MGAAGSKTRAPNENGGWCRHQPPLSKIASRAGEGVGAFLGRFRPEPFGPGRSLGFHSSPEGDAWFPNRTPTEISRLRWTPGWVLPKTSLPRKRPSRILPEGRFRRTAEESGFGLRLALLPQLPVHTLQLRSSLRMSAAAAVTATSTTAPFPEGRSTAAKVPCDSTSRVAPSGIFRFPDVDHVNPGDNFSPTAAAATNDAIVSPPRAAERRA